MSTVSTRGAGVAVAGTSKGVAVGGPVVGVLWRWAVQQPLPSEAQGRTAGAPGPQLVIRTKVLDFIDYFNRTLAKPFKWTYMGKPPHV